jgi:hypothetical protein
MDRYDLMWAEDDDQVLVREVEWERSQGLSARDWPGGRRDPAPLSQLWGTNRTSAGSCESPPLFVEPLDLFIDVLGEIRVRKLSQLLPKSHEFRFNLILPIYARANDDPANDHPDDREQHGHNHYGA